MASALVEMRGITKRFPGIVAASGVDLVVNPGDVLAVVGENGAGKTTLMNVLYGLYQPDEGEILLNGELVVMSTPEVAIEHHIGMVHQHFALVPSFTVADNVALGRFPHKFGIYDQGRVVTELESLSNQYGMAVDPRAKVMNLSVGVMQRVDKLAEVMAVSNRVTVMRAGKNVGDLETKSTSERELAQLMVGREVFFQVDKPPAKAGQTILKVENLQVKDARNLPALDRVDLSARAGEILGIAGVQGNGQTELVEAITGLRSCDDGLIIFRDTDCTQASVRQRRELGLAHIPEDRMIRGASLGDSLQDNAIIGSYYREPQSWRGIMLRMHQIAKHVKKMISDYDVRPANQRASAGSLSGGNMQKLILARELDGNPCLVVAAQPTRGLDVGATEFVHRQLVDMRNRGCAILMVSADLDEILNLSDRIAVMYKGKIVAEMPREDATEQKLGILMAGSSWQQEEASEHCLDTSAK
jgi:simple sugar transport system ATP-binding protein